jgi:hypothetical protein
VRSEESMSAVCRGIEHFPSVNGQAEVRMTPDWRQGSSAYNTSPDKFA